MLLTFVILILLILNSPSTSFYNMKSLSNFKSAETLYSTSSYSSSNSLFDLTHEPKPNTSTNSLNNKKVSFSMENIFIDAPEDNIEGTSNTKQEERTWTETAILIMLKNHFTPSSCW